MSGDIGSENRTMLRALADALVPAGRGMPSASEADVADAGIDHVLNVRPDIFADLIKALRIAAHSDPATALKEIASQDGEAFQALRMAVFGAYYNAPAVQQTLGYAGQPVMPFDPDAEPEYLPSLQKVIERGRF